MHINLRLYSSENLDLDRCITILYSRSGNKVKLLKIMITSYNIFSFLSL